MIASGSVVKQIERLYSKEHGAEGKAYLAVTHPVLLDKAIKLLDSCDYIEKVVTTNTLPLTRERYSHPKIEVLSIAGMLAEIIQRIHVGESISDQLIDSKI